MTGPLPVPWFLGGWLPAFAVTATVSPPIEPLVIMFDGLSVPVVTSALAAIGVIAARPLARKKEAALPVWQSILVTAIMLVVVLLWVIQSRPGWLFAFVVAIGLGFSGYSLIELVGEQIKDLVSSSFATAKDAVGGFLGKSGKRKSDAE